MGGRSQNACRLSGGMTRATFCNPRTRGYATCMIWLWLRFTHASVYKKGQVVQIRHMRIQIALISLAAIATTMFSLPTASAQSAAAPEPEQPPDPVVSMVMEERGVNRTEAERRVGWQSMLATSRDRAEAVLGNSFGGAWIAVDDDRPVVAVHGSAEVARKALEDEPETRALVAVSRVVEVARPKHEMDARAKAWLSEIPEVNSGARQAVGFRISEPLNSLVVMVPPHADLTERQKAFVAKARSQQGVVVRSEKTQLTLRSCKLGSPLYCNAPLRGGVQLDSHGCTAGFNVRSKSTGAPYVMTAGHCFDTATERSITVTSPQTDNIPHVIGGYRNHCFATDCDFAVVTINNAGTTGWNIRAWVAVTSSGGVDGSLQNLEYPIKGTGTSSEQMRVCTTGAYWGYTSCGRVTATNATLDGTYTGLARTDMCGTNGDSGAPVYSYNIAYGLQVGGPATCETYYQGIGEALLLMNVNMTISG